MGISIEQRVTNGANMLDERTPDWYRQIRKLIDIRSLGECVLGQVYGSWSRGSEIVGIDGDRESQEFYGFELTEDEYSSESFSLIAEQIETQWYIQINKRLDA